MKDRSWNHSKVKAGICGLIIAAVAITGAFILRNRMAAGDPHLTGTILARHGSICQRMVIEHSSGAIKSVQVVPCGDSSQPVSAPSEVAPSRYSNGARVDAIRESFKNR